MYISVPVPKKGVAVLKKNQTVDFHTPFLILESSSEIKIMISQMLNIKPRKIFFHVKKLVGEHIAKNDVIAVKKTLLHAQYYRSEHEGILKEINHEDGSLLIQTTSNEQKTIPSYFKGEVEDISKTEIKIKVKQKKDFPSKGIKNLEQYDNHWGGTVCYVDQGKENSLTEEDIADKILVSESFSPYNQIKLEALNARGFVSLNSLSQTTRIPYCLLASEEDMRSVFQIRFPYCILNGNNTTITFYHNE